MSWAAHQFEYYAVQGHLPARWRGKISFLAIVAGDLTCDFVGKLWSYGVDVGGRHLGPEDPEVWHRGWPGLGFSHSLLWGFLLAGLVYVCSRSRPWTLGILSGVTIHVVTDIGDSIGTMLLFPFSTEHFTIGAWSYGVTPGGRNLDAGAYYSSLGFVTDVLWLLLALTNWRCLTTAYWRREIVPADPGAWRWLGRWMPERALVTLYRSWFIYGVCRLVAWTFWAHVIEHHEWDLSWGGPAWLPKLEMDHPAPWVAAVVALLCLAFVALVVDLLLRLPERRWRRPEAPPARVATGRDRPDD